MIRKLNKIGLLTIGLLVYVVSAAQNTNTTKSGDVYSDNEGGITINKTYIDDQNKYYGLDRNSIEKIEKNQQNIKSVQEDNKRLSLLLAEDRSYIDSLTQNMFAIADYQRTIDSFERINDSVMESRDGDSIVYKELSRRYDLQLKGALSDLWERHPNFNPGNHRELVEFIEYEQRTKYLDLPSTSCRDVPRSANIRRDYPQCWSGIAKGNSYYLFEKPTWGIMGVTQKHIDEMNVTIRGVGTFTTLALKKKYSYYAHLKRYRNSVVDFQYGIYIKDPKRSIEEISRIYPKDLGSSNSSELSPEKNDWQPNSLPNYGSNKSSPNDLNGDEEYKRAYEASQKTFEEDYKVTQAQSKEDFKQGYDDSQAEYERAYKASKKQTQIDYQKSKEESRKLYLEGYNSSQNSYNQSVNQSELDFTPLVDAMTNFGTLTFINQSESSTVQIYIDGVFRGEIKEKCNCLRVSNTDSLSSKSYKSRKLSVGSHTIQLKDANGNILLRSIEVITKGEQRLFFVQ